MRRAPRSSACGLSLTESLVLLALLTWCLALILPAVDRGLQRARLRGAARDLATRFREARLEAVLVHRQVGIVFDRGCGYCYSIYLDGNGNGIRSADISSGVDRRLLGPYRVGRFHEGVVAGFLRLPRIPAVPPETGPLDLRSPVQVGPTDIVSFSPGGTCTSGTIYLAVGRERMAAVRLIGVSGRVKVYEFDPSAGKWEEQ